MRRLRDDESGAIAVYVALIATVLMGMAALVVDIGDVFWERRMLQNSADAAALAVAIDCAQGDCGTAAEYTDLADTFANENNHRGAYVESITGPGGNPPTYQGGEVTVMVRTGDSAGPGRLAQFFSGALGYEEGLESSARAKAIWGVPDLVTSASPLTISVCAWVRMTGITSWPPDPEDVAGLPSIAEAQSLIAGGDLGETVYYKDSLGTGPDADDDCNAPPGFYTDPDNTDEKLPAAFAWLDSASCDVEVTTDLSGAQWADAKPGASAGGESACVKALRNQDPPVAVFPLFVGINEGNVGTPDQYQLVAPAAFYLTGYRLPGAGPPAWSLSGPNPCSAPATCIRGHFVKKTELSPPVDDPSFGLISIRLEE